MSSVVKIVAYGVVAIVAFDTIASLASRSFGFPYVYATAGSWIIYAAVGFAIGRLAPISYAAIGVATVGFAEATVGWWFSWIIGPGRTKSGTLSTTQFVTALLSVIVMGAIIGAISGAVGHSRPSHESPAP
jgi:hypothetical protein